MAPGNLDSRTLGMNRKMNSLIRVTGTITPTVTQLLETNRGNRAWTARGSSSSAQGPRMVFAVSTAQIATTASKNNEKCLDGGLRHKPSCCDSHTVEIGEMPRQ